MLNFGMYKGRDIRSVPLNYLQAMAPALMSQARMLQDELDRRISDTEMASKNRPAAQAYA